MNFADALKAFRRGTHVYGPNWNGVVICAQQSVRRAYMEETYRIMDASSIPIASISNEKCRVTMEAGNTLEFRLTENMIVTGKRF